MLAFSQMLLYWQGCRNEKLIAIVASLIHRLHPLIPLFCCSVPYLTLVFLTPPPLFQRSGLITSLSARVMLFPLPFSVPYLLFFILCCFCFLSNPCIQWVCFSLFSLHNPTSLWTCSWPHVSCLLCHFLMSLVTETLVRVSSLSRTHPCAGSCPSDNGSYMCAIFSRQQLVNLW